jgi:hypothetical protein
LIPRAVTPIKEGDPVMTVEVERPYEIEGRECVLHADGLRVQVLSRRGWARSAKTGCDPQPSYRSSRSFVRFGMAKKKYGVSKAATLRLSRETDATSPSNSVR